MMDPTDETLAHIATLHNLPEGTTPTSLQIVQHYISATLTRYYRMGAFYEKARLIATDPALFYRADQAALTIRRWQWLQSLVGFVPKASRTTVPVPTSIVSEEHLKRWTQFGLMKADILSEAELYYGPDYQEWDDTYVPFVVPSAVPSVVPLTPSPSSPLEAEAAITAAEEGHA